MRHRIFGHRTRSLMEVAAGRLEIQYPVGAVSSAGHSTSTIRTGRLQPGPRGRRLVQCLEAVTGTTKGPASKLTGPHGRWRLERVCRHVGDQRTAYAGRGGGELQPSVSTRGREYVPTPVPCCTADFV
jgi:hypothetical protein